MKSRYGFFIIVLITFFAVSSLYCQQTTANITGKVSEDESGNPLKDVLITATDLNNGNQMTRSSDKKGKFRFITIPPSAYRVTFELEGFQTQVVNTAAISAEQTLTLKIKLKKKATEAQTLPSTQDGKVTRR